MFKEIVRRHHLWWGRPTYRSSAIVSLLFLVASLIISYTAGIYALEHVSNYVTDIILSNIPTFNLVGTFIYGGILFWICVTVILLAEPKYIPFTLKTLSLGILIRSAFITLTHLSPYPTQIAIDPQSVIFLFTSGADQFFSGHTAWPYLMALVFWENIYLRIFFTGAAVFFGIVVLLAHLHYSIDNIACMIQHLVLILVLAPKNSGNPVLPRFESLDTYSLLQLSVN